MKIYLLDVILGDANNCNNCFYKPDPHLHCFDECIDTVIWKSIEDKNKWMDDYRKSQMIDYRTTPDYNFLGSVGGPLPFFKNKNFSFHRWNIFFLFFKIFEKLTINFFGIFVNIQIIMLKIYLYTKIEYKLKII